MILSLSVIRINHVFALPVVINRINILFKAVRDILGRDLVWTPHIHILIAELKLCNNNSNGFYVYAEPKKFEYFKSGVEYVLF